MSDKNKKMPAAVSILKKSCQNRTMIFKLAKNDFKTKYAGSYLGILWSFVQPVTTILLYWFVFQVGLRTPSVGDYPFVLWLTAGLVPWFFFSDAWSGATTSLLEYDFLVKKVVFDIEIIPAIKVVSAFFVNIFFTLFMVILLICSGISPTLHMVQLVYYLFCVFVLAWGLSLFTSSVVVFVRDLRHFMSVVLQVLMWLTPIMWDISLIREDYPWLVTVMKINPVFYIVNGYRDAMLQGKWFWEEPGWTLWFWGLVLILFLIGSKMFQSLRTHFVDVL